MDLTKRDGVLYYKSTTEAQWTGTTEQPHERSLGHSVFYRFGVLAEPNQLTSVAWMGGQPSITRLVHDELKASGTAMRASWSALEQQDDEFDPGSGSTLAACLMHASRTGSSSGGLRGGRVRNTWATCPGVGDNPWKHGVIPHGLTCRVGRVRKAYGRSGRGLRPIR